MCAPHLSDPFMARPGRALERSCGNAAWLRAEMAQLERRQSHFLSRGEHGCCGEKPTVSHVPQRCQDSKPNRDYLEKEVEEERSRDGIASLMKAADLGRIREEWRVRQFCWGAFLLESSMKYLLFLSEGSLALLYKICILVKFNDNSLFSISSYQSGENPCSTGCTKTENSIADYCS